MNLYNNQLYLDDLNYVCSIPLPWDKLKNKTVLISGATGLVGSFLVDVIMSLNKKGLNCTVYALSRNKQKSLDRFSSWLDNNFFKIINSDITRCSDCEEISSLDYVLHLASNTHPLQYSSDPIGTITTNVIGLNNMLEIAVKHNCIRFVFASSNEIYGENRGDTELFDEAYCGYINCNSLRAGYPESKRCGESLCQAYSCQKCLDIVIPRLTRSYGPTMMMSDSKAISQFIKKAISGEDIVLKSKGDQYYSYTYVADAVSGLLFAMLKGNKGEAYNIADECSDIRLKDLASTIASSVNKKVIFEIPDNDESRGYSVVTKARLNGNKIKALGWKPRYDIKCGINRTIEIFKSVNM